MAGNIDPNEVTEWDIAVQENYLNLIQFPHNDYRFQFGFRLKKVMFGYRHPNRGQKQNSISVTFSRHNFNCSDQDVNHFNYVLVSPIVIPQLIEGLLKNQDILDFCRNNHMYGIFLFTTMSPFVEDNNLFQGKLFLVTYERNLLPYTPIGIIHAVYPYYHYNGNRYKVYLLFDQRANYHYYQTRLTKYEMVKGVHELDVPEAVGTINQQIVRLIKQPQQGFDVSYAAIYVARFATLTVFFENNNINHNKYDAVRQNFANKNVCHERVLIQRGGVVGLEKYNLGFQFMEDSPPVYYRNVQELAQSGRIVPVDNSDMSTVRHPLIVLGYPLNNNPETDHLQAPFPGYWLRVYNTDAGNRKPATLLFPTGAQILTVREFYPDSNDYTHGYQLSSNGWRHVIDLWNEETYKDSTGPYLDANQNGISGQIRTAFPNPIPPALDPLNH